MTHARYKEMLAIGELKTKMAVENLIVQVSSYYYDVIRQQSKVDAARHSLSLSEARYAEARDKYVLGVLSGLEARQAKLDLNADSSNYIKEKKLLRSAYIFFKYHYECRFAATGLCGRFDCFAGSFAV